MFLTDKNTKLWEKYLGKKEMLYVLVVKDKKNNV